MKKIYRIDWILAVSFVLSAISGLCFHLLCGHGGGRGVCREYGYLHEVPALVFLCFSVLHIKMHWAWYKGVFRNRSVRGKYNNIPLTVTFLVLCVTGLMILFGGCRQHGVKLWHSWSALLFTISAIIHLVGRYSLLVKSLRN